MPGEGVWSIVTMGDATREIVVSIQDRRLNGEVLAILSSHYDLIVRRELQSLPEALEHPPSLIVVDSIGLLRSGQAEQVLQAVGDIPVLALMTVDAHLQMAGPLLAEPTHDFLVRPFTAAELLLRVGRLMRQGGAAPMQHLSTPDLHIDPRSAEAYVCGYPLTLTRKEAALLHALARRMGRTVTRDELLDEVWGEGYEGTSNVLDVHIRAIRRKVEAVPGQPQQITTVRGVGYRLEAVVRSTTEVLV